MIWPSFRDEVFSQDRGDIWRQFFFVQLDGSWESVLNETPLTNLFLHRTSFSSSAKEGTLAIKTSQFCVLRLRRSCQDGNLYTVEVRGVQSQRPQTLPRHESEEHIEGEASVGW